ncbi:MAG: DUF1330 domain-containing protein [Parvibaculum sp.]|nr:DUF1330 domain-containing protein [Parvibaculum sp.]
MKASPQSRSSRLDALIAAYGEGGAAPAREQWQALLAVPEGTPVTLLNFFKLREVAHYPKGSAATACSGQEAFSRYSAVSMPGLEKAGGRFVLLAPFGASFIGETEDWDFVAAGSYPDAASVLALFEDRDYREAYAHRAAACERQKTVLCLA